jgi:hypothetical protein
MLVSFWREKKLELQLFYENFGFSCFIVCAAILSKGLKDDIV